MVQVTIAHRSKAGSARKTSSRSLPPLVIDFPSRHPSKVTVLELQRAIEAKFPKLHPTRQRLTTEEGKALTDADRSLDHYGVSEQDTLYLKDLGRQISWKTVFLVEYAGPLFIHPFFYVFGNQIYGAMFSALGFQMIPYEHSNLQKVALGLVLFHFAKRELETIFVHRFSNATMPFFNLFKNSAHYHLLSGVLLSFGIYGPWNGTSPLSMMSSLRNSPTWLAGWTVFILFCQASNFHTHMTMRNLRPAGSKVRAIPRGYGFSLVSCANYLFESLVWVGFTAMTGSFCAAIFTIVSAGQMTIWALKKHRNYKKEFGKAYPKNRKAIFPFIL